MHDYHDYLEFSQDRTGARISLNQTFVTSSRSAVVPRMAETVMEIKRFFRRRWSSPKWWVAVLSRLTLLQEFDLRHYLSLTWPFWVAGVRCDLNPCDKASGGWLLGKRCIFQVKSYCNAFYPGFLGANRTAINEAILILRRREG